MRDKGQNQAFSARAGAQMTRTASGPASRASQAPRRTPRAARSRGAAACPRPRSARPSPRPRRACVSARLTRCSSVRLAAPIALHARRRPRAPRRCAPACRNSKRHAAHDEGRRLARRPTPSISAGDRCRAGAGNRSGRARTSARRWRDRRGRRNPCPRSRRARAARGARPSASSTRRPARSGQVLLRLSEVLMARAEPIAPHCHAPASGAARARSSTISGGEPKRTGRTEQPSPPETIRLRPSSTMWP